MKKIITALLIAATLPALAMGDDYKKTKDGGYVYTGGAHLKGCSNRFQIGSTTKQFVIDCMKVDAIAVRSPDYRRSITDRYGVYDIIGFGQTRFYFQNGILSEIVN